VVGQHGHRPQPLTWFILDRGDASESVGTQAPASAVRIGTSWGMAQYSETRKLSDVEGQRLKREARARVDRWRTSYRRRGGSRNEIGEAARSQAAASGALKIAQSEVPFGGLFLLAELACE
jgi:hypothetical protein